MGAAPWNSAFGGRLLPEALDVALPSGSSRAQQFVFFVQEFVLLNPRFSGGMCQPPRPPGLVGSPPLPSRDLAARKRQNQ
jgi:hypothetical protein